MAVSDISIRTATAADAVALDAIYGHHAINGLGTFELEGPGAQAMGERLATVQAYGLPYLVAEAEGRVLGFAYANVFRARAAYRYTVEDSVYIAPEAVGKGVGKALLTRLIADCEALGLRQMMAVIGDSANAASRGLHRALGFEDCGVVPAVGWKHDRWVDIVFMTKALNSGADAPPDAPGIALG